ncbi:Chemotaxis response regulator protein-glutamate methylesterase [Andreprevotia sp. IGB-42]|uniref:response regulator n=1 Tax=Andreprevotia sp. IGB-42 TaxID=2497473 RepID=UPI00135AC830|nr:response regulator [Andreprevotia sp. IGB-42]KAF0813335.1 Chemotaxis response regulator protein-glutamate methylesterase [Andreprevotia sp. IGB-42]
MDTFNATPAAVRPRIDVLLVEDSPLIRDTLVEAFNSSGLIVTRGFAATAKQAIHALQSAHFDMAVIDLELEEGTGFDVLNHIAETQGDNPPFRVVLTNHAFPLYEKRARQLGIDHFFDKSMHFDDAVTAIEKEAARLLGTAPA